MNKGVVMEISKKHLIVMTPAGAFDRIPNVNRNCQLGEEILYADHQQELRQPAFAMMGVFIAAVVLCMALFAGLPAIFADKSVVAYISIDINPSVELGIDKHKKVREIRGLNDRGMDLVQNLSYNGRSLDDVTGKLLEKAEAMDVFASGEGDVVIAGATVKEDAALDSAAVTEQLKQQVLAHVVTKHPEEAAKIEVTAFAAPTEAIVSAQESGLSLGKYSVYLNAKSSGYDVKIEDLKQDSIHNIANVEGGISKLVDPAKLEKNSLKELIAEEKDGRLDKRMQDNKKENAAKSTPTPKSSSKNNTSRNTPASKASPSGKAASPAPPSKDVPAIKQPAGKDNRDSAKDNDKNNDRNNGRNNDGTSGGNGSGNQDDGRNNDKSSGGNDNGNENKNNNKNNGEDGKNNDRNSGKSNGKEEDQDKNDNRDSGKNGDMNGSKNNDGNDSKNNDSKNNDSKNNDSKNNDSKNNDRSGKQATPTPTKTPAPKTTPGNTKRNN
ncbi:MAG: RsgI [Paenibacillaceae bacterium]|jgi:hypothetical protein|nr:RsgI [Paenibacillaceae bacterium]